MNGNGSNSGRRREGGRAARTTCASFGGFGGVVFRRQRERRGGRGRGRGCGIKLPWPTLPYPQPNHDAELYVEYLHQRAYLTIYNEKPTQQQ